jgi:hypothetical protein
MATVYLAADLRHDRKVARRLRQNSRNPRDTGVYS